MSRTLHYETPSADAKYLQGTITSSSITQELPVPFRVPLVKNADGTNNMEATLALVHEMEDQIDIDIQQFPELARVPRDGPPS